MYLVINSKSPLQSLANFDDRFLGLGLAEPHGNFVPLFRSIFRFIYIVNSQLTLFLTFTTAPFTKTLSPSKDSPIRQSI